MFQKKIKTAKIIIVFIFFALISYGITSYSSTLTHSTVCGDLDSYCYRYLGMVVAKGGVPYLDAFDNKGPLIHILNCIGYLISRDYGVFIVEFSFMMLYLAVQYAIARRFVDFKKSLLYTFVAAGPIGGFFVGNMTEEYALVFISVGILVFVDYYLFNKKDWYRIVICGLACGAVLMLRPNMVAMWFVFCIYSIYYDIRHYRRFPLNTTLQFIAGVLAAVLPFLIWLGFNGAIEEFWIDYILTNLNYSSEYSSSSNIFNSFISFLFSSASEIYLLLLIFLIIKKQNREFNTVYLIYILFNLLIISLSGKSFEHYGMVTLPALVYPLAASSEIIKKNLKKPYIFELIASCLSVLLIGFIINMYFTTIPALIQGNPGYERNESIIEIVNEKTDPDDRILVLGYKDYYYVASDRMASSRFHYSFVTYENYPGGLEAVTEDINKFKPKLVIVEAPDYESTPFDFSDYYLYDEDLSIWMLKG